jgi:hypothetical protein
MVHRHGDDWAELKHVEYHDPSQHVPERQWLQGGQDFRASAVRRSRCLPFGNVPAQAASQEQPRFTQHAVARQESVAGTKHRDGSVVTAIGPIDGRVEGRRVDEQGRHVPRSRTAIASPRYSSL